MPDHTGIMEIAQGSGTETCRHAKCIDRWHASPLHQSWTTDTVGIDFDELQRTWVDAAKAQFQALTRRHRLDEWGGTRTVVVGRPAAEIVRFAREHEADLIVMGTHGYGSVKRLLLGSVADQVIRQAACPVLVVPHRSLRPEGTREIGALESHAGGSHDR